MAGYQVIDWDDAYENGGHIAGGAEFIPAWESLAAAFRQAINHEPDIVYGESPREIYDLFAPPGVSNGLFVFVHGGYWQRFDKSYWSHLAQGALARGWTVIMPSYPLCPDVSIAQIEQMIASAIRHAAERVSGPLILTGHSAGGHLVTRMACEDSPLEPTVQQRVQHYMPISGLFDLRPLINTRLNAALQLSLRSAGDASPALKTPAAGTKITAWVGASERAEFLRQNALICNVWRGLGSWTRCEEEPDRHHFDIIDGLIDPDSPLMRAAFDPA